MSNWQKTLETTSFVVLLATCGAVLYYVSTNTFRTPEPVNAEKWADSTRGRTMPADLVGGGSAQPKVLLALSTKCGYCEQNASFYRALADNKNQNFELIAVFPEATADAQRYLAERRIGVSRVLSRKLRDVNIVATPSILITDARGKVLDAWAGVLDQERERMVMSKLQGDTKPSEITQ